MKTNWKNILAWIAFAALAAISCYLTSESLYNLYPNVPKIIMWVVAIVFYVVASICFTMFLKAFDKDEYFRPGPFTSRAGHLAFGVLGLVFFWLVFSMPTNTHTLMYIDSVVPVLQGDIDNTKGYLEGLTTKGGNTAIANLQNEYTQKEEEVNGILRQMQNEIDNPTNPGIGPDFNSRRQALENALSVKGLTFGLQKDFREGQGRDRRSWSTTYEYYRTQAHEHLKRIKAVYDKEISEIRKELDTPVITNLTENLTEASKSLKTMKGLDYSILDKADAAVLEGYSYLGVSNHSKFVPFKDAAERERYTREKPITKTKALKNVTKVWGDFIRGEFDGHGFFYKILIALLIDIAAFIFFYIATKKEQY